MSAPDQLPDPDVDVDFEVTGVNLDAVLAAARRDVAALLGPDRHLADARIVVGIERSITDGTGLERVVEWGATVTGRAVIGPYVPPAVHEERHG